MVGRLERLALDQEKVCGSVKSSREINNRGHLKKNRWGKSLEKLKEPIDGVRGSNPPFLEPEKGGSLEGSRQ